MEWLIGRARGRSSGIGAAEKDSATSIPFAFDKDLKPYLAEKHTRDQLRLRVTMEKLLYCPDGLDVNEWIATHVIALHDNITTLFETLYELCTCSSMVAPGGTVLTINDERGKKMRCTARQYMESVLVQSQDMLNGFPRHHGQSFAAEFRTAAAVIRSVSPSPYGTFLCGSLSGNQLSIFSPEWLYLRILLCRML